MPLPGRPVNPPTCRWCNQPVYATPNETKYQTGWIHTRTNRELCNPQDASQLTDKAATPHTPNDLTKDGYHR